MQCEYCGKEVSFFGTICMWCGNAKIRSKVAYLCLRLGSIIGMIVGVGVGIFLGGDIGGAIGVFIGFIIGAIIGMQAEETIAEIVDPDQPEINETQPLPMDPIHCQGTAISQKPCSQGPNPQQPRPKQATTFEFECPHCQSVLEGDDTIVGRTIMCPKCGNKISIET